MADTSFDMHEKPRPGGDTFPPGRWLDRIVSFFALAGIASLLVAIVLTCADIAWRRIVGGAFVDTFDITKMCLVAAASLSIPYGFTQGTHVTVDLLVDRFPGSLKRILAAVIPLVAAGLVAFLFWLTWKGAALHYAYGDTTLNLQLPLVWYWAIFLFGLALSVLAALANAAYAVIDLRHRGRAS